MKPEARTNGTNGVHATSNGNGTREDRGKAPQDDEVVRLMIQALGDLGYTSAQAALSQESGVKVESALVEDFRHALLSGEWNTAENKLHDLELNDPDDLPHALFLIREQKFLEYLEGQQLSNALNTLRNELAPLKYNIDRLHFLSSLVMVSSPGDLRDRASWTGSSGTSRALLLRHLSAFISPNSMIPEARLTTLLDTARQFQVSECLYHTSSEPISYLIPNHCCPRTAFPLHTVHLLKDHEDEVWHAQYSPHGKYFASGSADGAILIYSANTFAILHRLNARTAEETRREQKDNRNRGINYMCFSEDESTLLTCSQSNVIVHWDVVTGKVLNQITSAHEEAVSSACWLPRPENGFVSGGLDKKLHLYGSSGEVLHTWDTGRIYDLKISHDGKYLVAICTECTVYVFDLLTRERFAILQMDHELTSVSISRDSSRLLLSCSPTSIRSRHNQAPKSQAMEVQEWSFPDLIHMRTVEGQRQGEFVIKSCYAGYDEQFIMSGSEDSDIYLWHRKSGTLLERISGHSKSVGSVSWSPISNQWASASDDRTVRIWGYESEVRNGRDGTDSSILMDIIGPS